MGARFHLANLLPVAAAGALLALAGPGGVSIARADEARRVPLEIGAPAGSCRVQDAESRAQAQVRRERTQEAMARLQDYLRQELTKDGGEPVVLNGRGYNYGRDERADPARELEVLQREMRRQQEGRR